MAASAPGEMAELCFPLLVVSTTTIFAGHTDIWIFAHLCIVCAHVEAGLMYMCMCCTVLKTTSSINLNP